jgi:hypothetical protein
LTFSLLQSFLELVQELQLVLEFQQERLRLLIITIVHQLKLVLQLRLKPFILESIITQQQQ